MVDPHLEGLREWSARRVAARRDFTFLRNEVARLARALESRSVSLNEVERRREITEAGARRDELAEALRRPDGTAPTVYELTLADAARMGLPGPTKPDEDGQGAMSASAASSEDGDTADGTRRPLPSGDIILRESQRILLDYLSQLALKNTLHARRAAAPAASDAAAR